MKYLQYILLTIIGVTCIMCTHKHKCCDDKTTCEHKESSSFPSGETQLTKDSAVVTIPEPIIIDSLLTLSKGACFGKCPVYNLLITQSGEIYLENKMFMDKLGQFKGQLSESELANVFTSISKIKYFDLEQNYPTNQKYFIPDLPNTNTAVYMNNKVHKIFNNNSAPNSLLDFEKFVANLILNHSTLSPVIIPED